MQANTALQPLPSQPGPAGPRTPAGEPWECWINSSGRGASLLKGQRFLRAAVNSPAWIPPPPPPPLQGILGASSAPAPLPAAPAGPAPQPGAQTAPHRAKLFPALTLTEQPLEGKFPRLDYARLFHRVTEFAELREQAAPSLLTFPAPLNHSRVLPRVYSLRKQ